MFFLFLIVFIVMFLQDNERLYDDLMKLQRESRASSLQMQQEGQRMAIELANAK